MLFILLLKRRLLHIQTHVQPSSILHKLLKGVDDLVITLELVGFIAVICTIIGAIIGYFTFQRNRDKDIEANATQQAEVNVKLNHIIKGVDDVKLDLRANERQINRINTELVKVNEGVKSAHKRIDKIDKEGVT